MSTNLNSNNSIHLKYLSLALSHARLSPPKPSNFRVGCVLVSSKDQGPPEVISTGYTLELPGNTHAEQCALAKLASTYSKTEDDLLSILTPSLNVTLYTTLEPCGKRLSGNTPCVQRIIASRQGGSEGGIRRVVFGAKEPGTFVQDSQSCRLLSEAGIDWEYIPDLEEEILQVAMEGHQKKDADRVEVSQTKSQARENTPEQQKGTNVDDISPEEKKRQEAMPRNPKKRMMEVPVDNN